MPPPIWTPSPAFADASVMADYRRWLQRTRGLAFPSYDALWQWSVDDLGAFWQSIWDYFELHSDAPVTAVLADTRMPGARWFEGARLNYVQQVMRHVPADPSDARPAIRAQGEDGPLRDLTWHELRAQVASTAAALRRLGVQRGDRVAAWLPNVPQTVVAFLACAAVGAVWSLCAPDMGPVAVLDRFRQITPKLLFATGGTRFGGRRHDRTEVLGELLAGLPSLQHWVAVPDADGQPPQPPARAGLARHEWADVAGAQAELQVDALPFDHPLWVVYSSGTTGLPKPIVHGHGGIVVEQLKMMALHSNLWPSDVYHWFSSSGWIMWNAQVAGLLRGCTIAIADGSPAWPDFGRLWRFVDQARVTVFGAGAAFFTNCMKAGVQPARIADLSRLTSLGSTGSPLPPEAYEWILREVRGDLWIAPISGGTDFAGAFLAGNAMLPLHSGEMQVRALGAKVEAWDEAGRPMVDEVGELVCSAPIPSMPLYLWGDADGRRLHDSYFDVYPGVWRHGDWLRIVPHPEDGAHGAVIYGRSDATINRQGIRMGTAELYRVVEDLHEVLDSLVVDLEYLGRESWMTLFVVMREGAVLDDALRATLQQRIRQELSARHVPNEIVAAPDVPRTLSGKKMEVPIKKLMLGQPLERVANPDAMANAPCLAWYQDFAQRHLRRTATP